MALDINPALDNYTEAERVHRRPALRPGYLSVKDRVYYLYARKSTCIARDMIELRHPLNCYPISGEPQTKVEGLPWDSRVVGRDLVLRLKNAIERPGYWGGQVLDNDQLGFFKSSACLLPDNEVVVTYNCQEWQAEPYPSGQFFAAQEVTEAFRIIDCDSRYLTPSGYQPHAPIVITDESHLPIDCRGHQLQFRCRGDETEFNDLDNMIRNPHFDVCVEGDPYNAARWYCPCSGDITRVEASGYVGDHVLQVHNTGCPAIQEVDVEGQPLTLDVWARGSGEAEIQVAYKTPTHTIVDADGAFLANDPDFGCYSFHKTEVCKSWPDWSHITIVMAEGSRFDPADTKYPTSCERIGVRLCSASGEVEYGAVRLHRGVRAAQYTYLDPFSTVEYELEDSELYRCRLADMHPYEDVWDADMQPVNDGAHEGFLVVSEEGEASDEDLSYGELTWEDPGIYGEASLSGYPQGVVPYPSGVRTRFGRRHLPYARIHGSRKLRQTQVFDNSNQPLDVCVVTEPVGSVIPDDVLIASPGNMYRRVDDSPCLLLRAVGDRREQLHALLFDAEGRPIIGDWVEFNPPPGLFVDPTGEYTNHAGHVMTEIYPSGLASPGSYELGPLNVVHRVSGVSGELDVKVIM